MTKFEHWKLKISCISWWPTVIIKTAQKQPFCEHRHDLRIAEYQQYHWSNLFFTWDMMESIKCSTEKWQITCYQWHKILVMSDKSWSETLCVDLSITCDNTQTFGGRCTILQQRVSDSWALLRFIIIHKIFALPYDIQYWLCFIFIWIEGFLTLFIEYRLLLQNIILPWTSYNCFNPLSLHLQWSPLSSFHWNADASIGCFIEFSCLTLRLGVNYTRVVKIIFFLNQQMMVGV